MLIPLALLAISKPKKYLSEPRSLITNFWSNKDFNLATQAESFPVIIISSTYTNNAIKEEPLE